MPLNEMIVRTAKPGSVDRKIADERGLYLTVTKSGSKLWRFKYRLEGKERKLALGSYPDVGLKEARARRDRARVLVDSGDDPSQARKAARLAAQISAANSFGDIGNEYIEKRAAEGCAEVTLAKARWMLGKLNREIGHRPVSAVSPHELLAVLKREEKAGRRETARRLRSFASRVFRYAVATARATTDPAQVLQGALVAPLVRHHAAITDPVGLSGLLRAIEGYSGQPATVQVMRLSAHLFQRPGEIRQMCWAEVDTEKAIWIIPACRMKQRQPHTVPLSRQALSMLEAMRDISGDGELVFPALGNRNRPVSENTVNAALRRLGYGGDVMTAHGFRSTASSLLNESGKWNPDAIERALSHADRNQVRAAYHRSAYWAERVAMAQWWSDYLDQLREGGTVIDLKPKAAVAG